MNDFIVLLGIPVIRSVAGWLNNALEDGKITLIEWKKLVSTILRIGVPAFILYAGFDMSAEVAGAIPLLGDYLFDYIKKLIIKKK